MKKITTLMLSIILCCVFFMPLSACTITPETESSPSVDNVLPTEKGENDKNEYDENFVPDIIDDDKDKSTDYDFDDSIKYFYENISFTAPMFNQVDGVFTSNGGGIAVADKQFPYGTLLMSVRSKNTVDTGFVFGYTKKGVESWEGAGIEYYFLFLGQGGSAYLGKTQDGNWSALKVVQYSSAVNENKDYNLKLVYKGNKILFYIDGELIFGYKDENPLKGTGFGFRTGINDVVFKNFSATSDYLY